MRTIENILVLALLIFSGGHKRAGDTATEAKKGAKVDLHTVKSLFQFSIHIEKSINEISTRMGRGGRVWKNKKRIWRRDYQRNCTF